MASSIPIRQKIVQSAANLLVTYNQSLAIRRQIDQQLALGRKILIDGILVNHFIYFFTYSSIRHKRLYKELKADPTKLGELLLKIYNNRAEREELIAEALKTHSTLAEKVFTEHELKELEATEKLPEAKKAEQQLKLFYTIDQRVEEEEKKEQPKNVLNEPAPITTTPKYAPPVIPKYSPPTTPKYAPPQTPTYAPPSQPTLGATLTKPSIITAVTENINAAEQSVISKVQSRNFSVPRFAKNISSSGQILVKKFISRYPALIASLLSGAIGTAVGAGIAGPFGALAGAGTGILFPKFIRNGGGGLLLRAGGGVLGTGSRMMLLSGSVSVGLGPLIIICVIGIIGLIVVLPILGGTVKSSIPLTYNGAGAPYAPSFPGNDVPASDINQCTFTRDGTAIPLKSNIVASFFSEISQKTGVPAAVLASVARHEVPGKFSSITDQSPSVVQNYDDSRNDSGDIGFMQINTTHPDNIAANTIYAQRAAQKLGKTFVSLGYCRENPAQVDNINLDFCNLRDSIAIAAEVLNGKLGSGTWANLDDLERASCWYHNINCLYPSKATGPYNYGKEVRQDFLSCRQLAVTPAPIPVPGSDLRLAIRERFNIQFTGSAFTERELNWAWEALTKAERAPNFYPLVKARYNSTSQKYINIVHSAGSSETFNGENPIRINIRDTSGGPFTNQYLFKQVLTHELAHVIHGFSGNKCQGSYNQNICRIQEEDGRKLTRYSEISDDEAFSEIVSYYILNDLPAEQPTFDQQLKWPSIHPLKTGLFPKHIEYMQTLLGGNF